MNIPHGVLRMVIFDQDLHELIVLTSDRVVLRLLIHDEFDDAGIPDRSGATEVQHTVSESMGKEGDQVRVVGGGASGVRLV